MFEIPPIQVIRRTCPESARFSIVLPSWNNLTFLKCCIESIQKNSRYTHQLIVHVNEGTDGTLEWIKESSYAATYSASNAGVCASVNAAASLAQTDYILYLNDDMYVCPDWDYHLLQAVQARKDDLFYFSSTMIEAAPSSSKAVRSPHDFGNHPDNFKAYELQDWIQRNPGVDWYGSCWPPSLVSTRLWRQLGGYDERFSPGFYSDPDFGMKLWQAGVRDFRGIGNSLVYHFRSKSTGRVVRNPGRKQFAQKWGIPSSFFYKAFLKMGEPAQAGMELREPHVLSQIFPSLRAFWIARFGD
ncbi:MAG: glycosyltransferase [Bacteroidia bacterium]|nr:glycosyltransferase [Bacteroidia bacterium]